jgi:mycothiol synthase
MATLNAQPGPARPPEPGYRLVRVPSTRRREGLARLLNVHSSDLSAIRTFADRCAAEGTPLAWLWASESVGTGEYRHACLAVPNPGRTIGLYLSPAPPRSLAQRAERAALIAAATEGCLATPEHAGSLPQALLEPEQTDTLAAFEEAGFERLADLAYLRRGIPPSPPPAGQPQHAPTHPQAEQPAGSSHGAAGPSAGQPKPPTAAARGWVEPNWPEGIRVASLAELPAAEGERLLREALEASYINTLDCPALCGLRSTEDVVTSHRSVGVYDPGLWWLVLVDRRAVGCMLINPEVAPETAELVYLGLAPEARGKGIARGLLALAIARLGARAERVLACAVDLQNTPALRLYERLGFRRFATRIAVVRARSVHMPAQ